MITNAYAYKTGAEQRQFLSQSLIFQQRSKVV